MTIKDIPDRIIRQWNSGNTLDGAIKSLAHLALKEEDIRKAWAYLEEQYDAGVVPLTDLLGTGGEDPLQQYRDRYWNPQAGEQLKRIIQQHNNEVKDG